ncbi:MAG: hypothetical protein C5B51_25155 [Terriglobia bacterium]|nr:MAG: hypothetical protein C5B51_25155 [Terriglobia bacterium]
MGLKPRDWGPRRSRGTGFGGRGGRIGFVPRGDGWRIQSRDANCTAERDLYEGGTAATPAYLACPEAMTRGRTKELVTTYAARLK